jgi:hypothetical protein
MEEQLVELKHSLQREQHNMGLLDLKSDLSAAFNRKTKTVSDMINVPDASQLDYDATPKPYKIPNNGQGIGVKYDPSSQSYKAESNLSTISDTSKKSGRHNISSIETTQGVATGRHENIDIEIQPLAPTPAKSAVEPITMSATPVKQGTVPILMPSVIEKIGTDVDKMQMGPIKEGTDVDKIPSTNNIEKQSPKVDNSLYEYNVGQGVLSEMDPDHSSFNIDDIPLSHWSHGNTKPLSQYVDVSPANDIIDPSNNNIFTIDASIVGANINTPYTITPTFSVLASASSLYGYIPNSDVDFLTGPQSLYAINPHGSIVGGYGNLGSQISLNTQQSAGVNFFRPNSTWNQPRVLELAPYISGFTPNIAMQTKYATVAPYPQSTKYPLDDDPAVLTSGLEPRGITDLQAQTYRNLTSQLTLMPTDGSASQTFFSGISTWSYSTLWNTMITGGIQLTNPYVNTYTIAGASNPGDTATSQDFLEDISLTDNFITFSYGGVSHTNKYASGLVMVDALTNDGSNYVIPNLGSSPWNNITPLNFFDVTSTYSNGFEHYDTLALSGPSNNWTQWEPGAPMPSLFTGITEGNYDNPSIYALNELTNFFDASEDYIRQFTLQGKGNSLFASTFVNVNTGELEYDPLEITVHGNYAHRTLFDLQMTYWDNNDSIDRKFKNFGDINQKKYKASGLPPSANGDIDFSKYVNESKGTFVHSLSSKFPYADIMGGAWAPNLANFKADVSWTGCPTPEYYASHENAFKSWIRTDSELEGKDSADGGEDSQPLYITDDLATFYHPSHNTEKSTYGWGLGKNKSLSAYAGETHGTYQIGWRLPFGKKHVSYLGAPKLIGTSNAWKDYKWGTQLYGTAAGSAGSWLGLGGKSGGAAAMYLNPIDHDKQVFNSTGAGLDSMGGKSYQTRMLDLMLSPNGFPDKGNSTSGTFLGNLWNSINPFDELADAFDQIDKIYSDTTKRLWEQHNAFSVIMSSGTPQGAHRGLPIDAGNTMTGRVLSLISPALSNGTGLSARKYWSVLGYAGIQIAADLVDTGQVKQNDFRTYVGDTEAAHLGMPGVADYLGNNIYKRHGMPKSGEVGLDRRDYRKIIPRMGDSITMEDIITGDPLAGDYKDFIKFSFKDVINNENFRFRAYITGLTDTISPNWGQYNYVGRPDPVFQYNGASARTISFNLKVAALARQDMYWMWKKINKMVGLCYPAKYNQGQYMVGPMMELTIGDYISKQPGFLNSLNISVQDNYPWEINAEGYAEGSSFAGVDTSSVGGIVSGIQNAWDDPLGTAMNIVEEIVDDDTENKAARSNDVNAPPDGAGKYIAQLPHIVDLSIGYTLIGDQVKSAQSQHFGPSNPEAHNKDFFRGWNTSTSKNQNDQEANLMDILQDPVGSIMDISW